MAGIGFELKKIFAGKGIAGKAWGYSCAAVIVSGPTFLAVLLLIGLQRIAMASNLEGWDILLGLVTYAMFGALIASSVISQILSRWAADALYSKNYDRVLPSLFGGYAVIMVPSGILYALLLRSASPMVSTPDLILAWLFFALMVMVYLELSYLTALKNYLNVLLWFVAGVIMALVIAYVYVIVMAQPVITSILTGLIFGYGVIFCGYTIQLYRELPVGSGSKFRFIEYIFKYPQLILNSLLSILMVYSHIIVVWFSRYGEHITGFFYRAPIYDTSAFYAFLVSMPTNILFVVSMETHFYEKFRIYFDAVSSNGTLKDLDVTGRDMINQLWHEMMHLELVQLIILMAYMALMRFYLATIGFTRSLLIIFFLLSTGYAIQSLGQCMVLLLLYFDDRRGAVISSLVGFVTTTLATHLLLPYDGLLGLGFIIGALSMFLVAFIRLRVELADIDNKVFASQPIFEVKRRNPLSALALLLDRKAIEREEKRALRVEEARKKAKDRRPS